MNKIQRVSHYFRLFFTGLLFAAPLAYFFYWLNLNESFHLSHSTNFYFSFLPQVTHLTPPFSLSQKLGGSVINLIPFGLDLFILYLLIKLFRGYEQAHYFSVQAVNTIRRIGIVMLISELVNPFCQALTTAVLSWNNPPGSRFISISVDNTDINTVIIALLIILVSWIMAEGKRMNEEQQLTV